MLGIQSAAREAEKAEQTSPEQCEAGRLGCGSDRGVPIGPRCERHVEGGTARYESIPRQRGGYGDQKRARLRRIALRLTRARKVCGGAAAAAPAARRDFAHSRLAAPILAIYELVLSHVLAHGKREARDCSSRVVLYNIEPGGARRPSNDEWVGRTVDSGIVVRASAEGAARLTRVLNGDNWIYVAGETIGRGVRDHEEGQ